jgi:hypothetical protein
MYDKLKFRNILVEAGLNDKQADGIVKGLTEVVMDDIATKTDLERVANKLTIRFGAMMVVAVGILSAVIKLL